MNCRTVLLIAAAILGSYLAGRYSAPAVVKTEVSKTTSKDLQIAELTRQLVTKSLQTNSVTTTVQTPDGTIRTRTRVSSRDDSVESVIQASEIKERVVEKIVEKKVIQLSRGVVISALAAMPLKEWSKGAVFGASFSKPILGPVQIGAFVFTDLRVGLSLGLEF